MVLGIKKTNTNKVPVVKHLEMITHLDREVNPEHLNVKAKNVEAVWKSIEALYRSGAYPGISICIRKHGELVLNRALGFAQGGGPEAKSTEDDKHKKLMRTNTPVCLFSASKAVTAILTFKCIETGLLSLDDRVVDYIPEFDRHGKGKITIGHLLSHRAGIPWYQAPKDVPPEQLGDWDSMLQDIYAMRLQTKVGTQAYHAFTGGFVLGEIIQRVTGKSINEYLHDTISGPMGMKYFQYGLAPEHRDKVAINYAAGEPVRWPITKFLARALSAPLEEVVRVSNTPEFMDSVVPAGNLYATAEEMSRFYQMLLNQGEYDGQRILKRQTVLDAIKPASDLAFDRTLMMPMQFSHGFMLGRNPAGMYGVQTGNAYGHIGFMNIFGWADPDRDLAVGLLVSGKAILGTHLLHLGKFLSLISLKI